MPDRRSEPATARSLVASPVQEAFDLGVADVLFILQGTDVVADERVDAVSESACGLTERQAATQPCRCRGVATVVDM